MGHDQDREKDVANIGETIRENCNQARCRYLGDSVAHLPACCGSSQPQKIFSCQHPERPKFTLPGCTANEVSMSAAFGEELKPITAGCCATCPYDTTKVQPADRPLTVRERLRLEANARTVRTRDVAREWTPRKPNAIRNLVTWLCPLGDSWKRHVGIWRRNAKLFDGVKIATVAYGDNLPQPGPIVRELASSGFHVLVAKNDPELREVAGWVPALELLKRVADPDSVTFSCHSKGVLRDRQTTCHEWADAMYRQCLEYPEIIAEKLQSQPMVGEFKKIGAGFPGSRSDWHYSGTFYWFRNSAVFSSPRWNQVDRTWWGAESWPSIVFAEKDAGELAVTGTVTELDLYKRETWIRLVETKLRQWREQHVEKRTHNCLGEYAI